MYVCSVVQKGVDDMSLSFITVTNSQKDNLKIHTQIKSYACEKLPAETTELACASLHHKKLQLIKQR